MSWTQSQSIHNGLDRMLNLDFGSWSWRYSWYQPVPVHSIGSFPYLVLYVMPGINCTSRLAYPLRSVLPHDPLYGLSSDDNIEFSNHGGPVGKRMSMEGVNRQESLYYNQSPNQYIFISVCSDVCSSYVHFLQGKSLLSKWSTCIKTLNNRPLWVVTSLSIPEMPPT